MTQKQFTVEEMQNWDKRFKISKEDVTRVIDTFDEGEFWTVHGNEAYNLCILLNNLNEENQVLQRHIKRNTFNKIRVEDVFNCAKYDKFFGNKEAIKSIDWIAKQLRIDLE